MVHSSFVIFLTAMAFGCSEANFLNLRKFVQNMKIEDQVETLQSEWKSHELFKYLRQKYSLNTALDHKQSLLSFSWSDCGSSHDIVKVKSVSVNPDPIRLPGTLNVSFAADFIKTIDAPLKMEVKLEKHEAFFWLPIPCIEGIGSCTYDDVCETLMHAECPPALVAANIPCKCPFPQGSYSLPFTSKAVDPGTAVPSGEYRVTVNLSMKGQPVACLNVEANLA